jgi:receptor protein-tyrosine kinase
LVIIDSPPLLPVSDASLIAPHADQVIVVVNARRTRTGSLRQASDRLLIAKGRLSGVVLNQTTATPAAVGYYRHQGVEPSELVSSG